MLYNVVYWFLHTAEGILLIASLINIVGIVGVLTYPGLSDEKGKECWRRAKYIAFTVSMAIAFHWAKTVWQYIYG